MAENNNSHAADTATPVQIHGLCKSFGQQCVLDGIDLSVARGETLAVLGRSGTGKSVLLKLIVGLFQPDSGKVEIEGREVTGLALDPLNKIRLKLGFLFQQAALYDSLSVEENVAFPLRRHSKLKEQDLKNRVQELLSMVGMEGDSQKMPGEISGGMRKRVGLARALALEPSILLFDEPSAGLDPITSSEIDELILKLQKEKNITSVIVTHDIHSAKTVSNRVALLKDGRVLLQGTFADLENSDDSFVKQFLSGT